MILVAAAWAGVVPTETLPEQAYAPRRVAVLVGVQDYRDPALQGLKFPVKDANDLAGALRDPEVGDFDRVHVIDRATATTRAALVDAVRAASADLQRDDTFVLYLSGHGTLTIDPAAGSRLWFLPSDGVLDAPERTGLAVADLEAMVQKLPARRRVLILDTCHNGRSGSKSTVSAPTASLLQSFRGEPPAPRDLREVSESEARLYAAQFYQPAMEDSELGNGVYTHYLIEGLKGARSDLDGDGLVDVAEAHEYARDRTISYTGGIQVPRAEYRIVGREEIFLAGRPSARSAAEQALLSACDEILSRARLWINGTARGELPGLYAVEPGVHDVRVETADGRTLLRRKVRFAAGTTTPVEDLVKTRPTVAVLGGVSYVDGPPAMHTMHSSAMASLALPFGERWRPDLHVGIDLARGALSDDPDGEVEATTGAVFAGGTFAATTGSLWMGPTAAFRLPYRWSALGDEADPAASGGLAAGWSVPLGAVALQVRADGLASWVLVDGQPQPTWGAALRVGLGTVN